MQDPATCDLVIATSLRGAAGLLARLPGLSSERVEAPILAAILAVLSQPSSGQLREALHLPEEGHSTSL